MEQYAFYRGRPIWLLLEVSGQGSRSCLKSGLEVVLEVRVGGRGWRSGLEVVFEVMVETWVPMGTTELTRQTALAPTPSLHTGTVVVCVEAEWKNSCNLKVHRFGHMELLKAISGK